MACSDQITPQDLENAKDDATFLGEVATSREGAVSTGAPITEATNRFGEVTDTVQGRLNKLGVIYSDPIKDWTPSTLVSQLEAYRYPATTGDIYIPVAPLPFTTGATFNTANWILYNGTNDEQIENIIKNSLPSYTDLVFDTVANMQAGLLPDGTPVILKTGDRIKIEERDNSDWICGTDTSNGANILDTGVLGVTCSLIEEQRENLARWGDDENAFDTYKLLHQKVHLSAKDYDFSFVANPSENLFQTYIIGAGTESTNINVVANPGIRLQSNSSPSNRQGQEIRDLSISVDNANALFIEEHHFVKVSGIYTFSSTNNGLYCKDSWLNMFENSYFQGQIGVFLEGANHANNFTRCRMRGDGKTNYCLYINDQGTAPDENAGIKFDTCDFEFSDCRGIYHNSARTNILENPYMEELGSIPIVMQKGKLLVNGGIIIFNGTTGGGADIDRLVQLNGGEIIFRGTHISSHQSNGFGDLTLGDTGKVSFYDCTIALPTQSRNWFEGEPFARGRGVFNLVNKNPANFNGVSLSGGGSNPTPSWVNGFRRWDVVSTELNEIVCRFEEAVNGLALIDGSMMNVMIIYRTNSDWNVRFAGAAFGGTPLSASNTLENTNGDVRTRIYQGNFNDVDEATQLFSIYNSAATAGDYIEIKGLYVMYKDDMDFESDLFIPA